MLVNNRGQDHKVIDPHSNSNSTLSSHTGNNKLSVISFFMAQGVRHTGYSTGLSIATQGLYLPYRSQMFIDSSSSLKSYCSLSHDYEVKRSYQKRDDKR